MFPCILMFMRKLLYLNLCPLSLLLSLHGSIILSGCLQVFMDIPKVLPPLPYPSPGWTIPSFSAFPPLLSVTFYWALFSVCMCGAETGHWCWMKAEDHDPWPAGSSLFSVAQNTTGFLCHKSTLLAHGSPGPQVLSCKAMFHMAGLQCVLVPEAVPAQMQDFVLEPLHEVPVVPFLQFF